MNKLRFGAGIAYCITSFVLFGFNYSFFLSTSFGVFTNDMPGLPVEAIWWSLSWVTLGIGAWLINTRDWNDDVSKKFLHYVFYYFFASAICTLSSIVAGLSSAQGNFVAPKFWSMTALVGLAGGFSAEKIEDLLKLIRPIK